MEAVKEKQDNGDFALNKTQPIGISISGNEKAAQVAEFAKAVAVIFESGFKNHVESSVLEMALRGLTKTSEQNVSISNCSITMGETS